MASQSASTNSRLWFASSICVSVRTVTYRLAMRWCAYPTRNLMEMTARSCLASRVSTRSVLRKLFWALELTIQPFRENVRTFHGSQHTKSKLHSSSFLNARGSVSPMASCLGIGGHTGGFRHGHPRYTSAHIAGRPWWLDRTHEHVPREHATNTNEPKTDTRIYKHGFGDPCEKNIFSKKKNRN